MFDALKDLVADLTGDDQPPNALDENEYQVAAAALLVHAASIDDDFSQAERDKLIAMLKRRFALDAAAAEELIEKATAAERHAVDLYRFTRVLNDKLDHAGRCRMIEMLWQIAYADGELSPYEDNLIWRVADLLGVDARERIALRRRIAASASRT